MHPGVAATAMALAALAVATPPRAVSASTEPPSACSARLVVDTTAHPPSCFIDERVTRAPGVLEYACAGGAAAATFGDSRFAGSVAGGHLDLGLHTRFTFSDHCRWESHQRIQGALASKQLSYSYSEAPLPGQKGCAHACRATATVRVE